jgi:hypothetical protein
MEIIQMIEEEDSKWMQKLKEVEKDLKNHTTQDLVYNKL